MSMVNIIIVETVYELYGVDLFIPLVLQIAFAGSDELLSFR